MSQEQAQHSEAAPSLPAVEPKSYDFLRVDESDPSTVYVDHAEYTGKLEMRRLTYRQRLEVSKLRGAYLSDTSTVDDFYNAEAYAYVSVGITGKGFDASEIVDGDLIEGLYEVLMRFLGLRQAAS